MRDAFHALFSEFLDAIWRGVCFGITGAIMLLMAFHTLKGIGILKKAAQVAGGLE
jgi:hypothetical protein